MIACYVDESGDTGALPSTTSPIQPLFCILGLTLDLDYLHGFTLDFVEIKARFFPGLCTSGAYLNKILWEVKGNDIRSAFRSPISDRRRMHHHIGFLDEVINLVKKYKCRIFGMVWIKPICTLINGRAIYTSSLQNIHATFNDLLGTAGQSGIVICDSRTKDQNRGVSFSIFTQKFKTGGDAYPTIIEMPSFGHSENHAGLQVCDLFCSGLLFPIAAYTYCTGYVTNISSVPTLFE